MALRQHRGDGRLRRVVPVARAWNNALTSTNGQLRLLVSVVSGTIAPTGQAVDAGAAVDARDGVDVEHLGRGEAGLVGCRVDALTGQAKTHDASPQQDWVTTWGIGSGLSANATAGSLR